MASELIAFPPMLRMDGAPGRMGAGISYPELIFLILSAFELCDRTDLRTNTIEYVAKHSAGDKIQAICLVFGLGCVIGFFVRHPRPVPAWGWLGLYLLFCINCVYVYRVFKTTITFETDQISFRIPPFVEFSEPYGAITEIKAKAGSLVFKFSDGKHMTRWSGLGDFDRVSEILAEKTPVLPTY